MEDAPADGPEPRGRNYRVTGRALFAR